MAPASGLCSYYFVATDNVNHTIVIDNDGLPATNYDISTINIVANTTTFATLAFTATTADGEEANAIHSDWITGGLTTASNTAVVAAISANEVSVSGTVPYYTTAFTTEIAGESASVSTGHNIFAFSVDLINVGSGATVTQPLLAASKIDQLTAGYI